MFYGTILKPNSPVTPTKKDGGDLLHLSQLCLNNPKINGKTYVQVVDGDRKFNVACLEKDKSEQATVDLFISTDKDIKLQTTGAANEVHVVGFFEPEPSDMEEMVPESSKRRSQFIEGQSKKKRKPGDFTSKENDISTMNETADDDDSEDDNEDLDDASDAVDDDESGSDNDEVLDLEVDEDNEEDDDEEFDEDEDDDDEDDEEDDEDEDEEDEDDDEANGDVEILNSDTDEKENEKSTKEMKVTQKNDSPKSPNSKISPKSNSDNKNIVSSNDSDTKFVTSLKQFLKENGRCNIGLLGSKVKKPAEVKEKLGAFLRARQAIFKIEDDYVSLVG